MELNKDLYIDNVKDYLENGKNLWNYNATNTIVGVTSTYNNSTLTLNGTATGEVPNISHTNMVYLNAGTYTFKIVKESGSATGSQAIIFKNYTTNTTILNTTLNLSSGNTFTFTLENSAWVSLAIYFFASNVFTNLKLDIQIEKGDIATPYEEYYGKYLNKGDGILIPYTLYDNSSGSTGNITLSDNVENYKYIEIYYKDEANAILCQKTYNNSTILFLSRIASDGANFQPSRTIQLSQNTITTTRYGKVTITNSGSVSVSSSNNIYITRVIGYK